LDAQNGLTFTGTSPPAFFAAFGWQLGARCSLDRCDNSRAAGVRLDRSFQRYQKATLSLVSIVGALQQASRTVPIVFVMTIDPVGSGFVASLARPASNATGFTAWEFGLGGKWLELLKEIAPAVTRVAMIRDPAVPAGSGGFAAAQTVAPSMGVELTPIGVRDAAEIESGIAAFARRSSDGLIMVGPPSSIAHHRDLIIALAAQHRLPAVYPAIYFVRAGGLISYGPDPTDQYRRAAEYVDRILKGERTTDLPVQAPTKYEMGLNLKTAKALGLEVPATLLARADEVIE
jgi:ABC-type uncharacterized transport system substrate-binding protein